MIEMTRNEAISRLRRRCVELCDDEHSLCLVAARLDILCGGFSQWKLHELRERYDWIVKNRPGIGRPALEDLANRWQLARQFVLGTELSCDTQLEETHHRTCDGWAMHSDEDLARFWHELFGGEPKVAPDSGEAAA